MISRVQLATACGAALFCVALAHAAEPVAVIPFRYAGKLMLVDVQINGSSPAVFVIDKGASHTVLDSRLAKSLALPLKEAPAVKGAGAGSVSTLLAPPVKLAFGEFVLPIPEPWVIDLSNVPIPEAVRGLVGAEMFKSYVVRIDPVHTTITLFAPVAIEGAAAPGAIPLLVEGNKFFLEAVLEVNGRTATHKLRIDTGSESTLNDELVRESREVHPSIGGNGLGENFASVAGFFDSVRIGPFSFEHVWATGDPGPAIGMELLERFILTFDARHEQLYLDPRP
jgi:hypothetical protein